MDLTYAIIFPFFYVTMLYLLVFADYYSFLLCAGESSGRLKEGNTAMAFEDNSTAPESCNSLSLSANVNAFPELEKHPQPASRSVEVSSAVLH